MSEGIQEKKEQQQRTVTNETEIENEGVIDANLESSHTPSTSNRASSARAGLLLVEVYGKVVRKQDRTSPQHVLLDFIQRLVDLLKEEGGGGEAAESSSRQAQVLVETLDFAFQNAASTTKNWNKDFIEDVVQVLQYQTASLGVDKEQVIQKLRGIADKTWSSGSMDHSYTNDGLGALGQGVADRIAPSDSSQNIVNILADIGPACTRSVSSFRETLADIITTGVNVDEPALARIIYFFSDKEGTAENVGTSGMSSALLGSLLPGRGTEVAAAVWSLRVVAQVLAEDYAARDWVTVATYWDFPGFSLRSPSQFRMLLELYRAGAQRTPPLVAFTTRWRNYVGQVSLIENMMIVPPAVYMCPLNEEELADAATAATDGPSPAVNPQCWASLEILQRLLYLSDIPSLYRRVRDLFVKGLLSCPEVLLCALVRLQLHVANAPIGSGRESLSSVGVQMKTELMRELIPLFFRPNGRHRVQNGPAALRRLYAISPTTVTAACFEAWRSTATEPPQVRLATLLHIINIVRVLPSPENAVGSLLNGSKDPEFSIAVAFVMADSEFLQLKPWLAERLSSRSVGHVFAVALVSYLAKLYTAAAPRSGEGAQLVSLENIAISLQTLHSLDSAALSQLFSASGDGSQGAGTLGESIKALTDACLNTHPSLRGSVGRVSEPLPPAPNTSSGSSDDVEEMATAYFQQIYTSEQSIGEVVAMLKRFKTSGNAKENEIFACMVHNLFDEYRFFSKYPEKELRITGILFGTLIQEQLVSSITLGIALRYVLEALRKPPSPPGSTSSSSGKMFRFGMFALEQFKGRLHEWPQYCSHIVQIPHLREGYADLVAEIENAMAESQNRSVPSAAPVGTHASAGSHPPSPRPIDDDANSQSGSSVGIAASQPMDLRRVNVPTPSIPPEILQRVESSATSVISAPAPVLPESPPRIAVFGPKLGKAVRDEEDAEMQHVSPPDAVLDRVQFLVNNLAPSNVEQKAQELKDMLDPKYFGWLGHFLVVKRITVQANFHALYLSFLDQLGEYGKGLVEAILASVYVNIGKLLRSPKITTSTSERSLLKNLGSWLGQITLARNRPVPQLMLDCKELLFQGYETGKLIAVAPFVAKTLEGAKNSIVFRPPNPWLMAILGVFRSLYNVEDLKMNIKFEVEVLCKNIGIKLEDIPLRDLELAKRIPPVKERNPDFNIKSSAPQSMIVSGSAAEAQMASSSNIASPDPKAAVGPVASTALVVSDAATDGTRNLQASGNQDQQTLIPNLAAYVSINSSLSQLLQQAPGGSLSATLNATTLKQAVPIAVDRAIREIISPVVERSVTIACLTTKEIVTKDFAMESDENKIRKAGQLMVANLAGSLALVTCREPLRTSVSNHLRQLLTSGSGRTDKHTQEEQNIIDQCVQICATDNLDLGCMLIEKAATEKAVRDVDEALGKAINARRKHREQTGQPYYDMSIFSGGSQRYPAALPEQLRPKPGGLRNEHFQLYESFQRMPRPTVVPANLGTSGSGGPLVSSRAPGSTTAPADTDAPAPSKVVAGQLFSIEALSALASKLDNAVVTLLTAAGQRAPDIKLTLLPPDHQVRQIIAAVAQVMPNANPGGGISRPLAQTEQDAVLGFSQSVFKRLYELSLTEPLRLEALVALLETINGFCPKLGKDIGTWATYAPTNTDSQRRLHRTVLLLLVRSNLLQVQDLDGFLAARADSGRNHIWVEFSFLFIRTAFLERIASPPDFPKLIDLMTSIADGRSQANVQISQTYRKPILRMLEEIRAFPGSVEQKPNQPIPIEQKRHTLQESSLSAASLSNFALASKKAAEASDVFARHDPPNAKQQVAELLDAWVRIQNEGHIKEQAFAPYLQRLQQLGVGRVDEHTERFLRVSVLVVVEAVLKSGVQSDVGKMSLSFNLIDIYCELLCLMFRHMNAGGSVDQVASQRLSVLNKILGVIMRSMMWDFERSKTERGGPWDQRPWFRIVLNLVCDLNKPDPALDAISLGMLSVFGASFHVVQPLAMPAFAFSWLELVSHRMFLPNLLLIPGERGWNIAHQLLIDHFLFLEPYLRRIELTPAVKKLYEGTLRVLLVILHDFPSFLAHHHVSLCNVIPESCVQLRNLVLSANPKGMMPPDPFTPNLKIDLLPEIQQSPIILSDVLGPIEGIRGHLDVFLKDGQRREFLVSLLPRLYKEGTSELDAPKVHSLVIYIGIHALARLQTPQINLSHTPEMEVLQKLMELDDRGRYISLNAIANQLRYPSSHTHYFSCVMLFLFSESKNVAVKEQVTRVLLERLILHRPHPWGLLITFIELIKNQRYGFWNFPFTRCATEIERVFENVARSCMPPGAHRPAVVVAGD